MGLVSHTTSFWMGRRRRMERRKDAAGVSGVMALRRKSGVLLGLPWPPDSALSTACLA